MLNFGLLLLRIGLGVAIYIHGAQKLFGSHGGPGITGTSAFLSKIGLRPAKFLAMCVALAQTLGGAGIVLGFATPISAGFSAITLFVAVNFLRPKGFSSAKGGYEYALLLAIFSFALVFTGPGKISIDYFLNYRLNQSWIALSSGFISILITCILIARQNFWNKNQVSEQGK